MSTESGFGLGGDLNWLVGSALSGIVSSVAFGVLLWIINPEIVTLGIPAIYGLEPSRVVGWAFHLIHGAVIGVAFGLIVTRDLILGTITADVESDGSSALGLATRLTLAGFVFGLLVWSILPMLVLPAWASISGIGGDAFGATPFESLLGHLVYGLLLGALFSIFVDTAPEAEATEAPFEEASE